MKILRVFPRRTNCTPTDAMAFVGDPPLWRPEADEVHISLTFTWDRPEAYRLWNAWAAHYGSLKVSIGGPALNYDGPFTAGLYVKHGVTFTSRGCNNRCPWCLVPEREGKFRTIPIMPGHIVQDNNLLQAPKAHIEQVFAMLKSQRRAATFSGGLDATLLSDSIVEGLRGLRIDQLFLASDTEGAIKPLRKALDKLKWLPRDKLRCYILIAYGADTVEQARNRLEAVWEAGAMPFAQLYQPSDKYIRYSQEWRGLARIWSRPAAMRAVMRRVSEGK